MEQRLCGVGEGWGVSAVSQLGSPGRGPHRRPGLWLPPRVLVCIFPEEPATGGATLALGWQIKDGYFVCYNQDL